MKPSFVVGGQDGIRAPPLEAGDKGLQAAERPSDELVAAERLQAAVILRVVLLDQVIDAHRGVAVCHVEPTAYTAQRVPHMLL